MSSLSSLSTVDRLLLKEELMNRLNAILQLELNKTHLITPTNSHFYYIKLLNTSNYYKIEIMRSYSNIFNLIIPIPEFFSFLGVSTNPLAKALYE